MDDGPGTAGIPSVHSIVMRLLNDDEPDSQGGVLAFNYAASDCESGNFDTRPRQQQHQISNPSRLSPRTADVAVKDVGNARLERVSSRTGHWHGNGADGPNQGGDGTATTGTDTASVASGNREDGSEMPDQRTVLAGTTDSSDMEDGQTPRSETIGLRDATVAAAAAAPADDDDDDNDADLALAGASPATTAAPSSTAAQSCSSPVIPRFGEWDAALAGVPVSDPPLPAVDAPAAARAPSPRRSMVPYSSDDDFQERRERERGEERGASEPKDEAEASTAGNEQSRKDAPSVTLPRKRPDGRDYRCAAEGEGYSALFELARRYARRSALCTSSSPLCCCGPVIGSMLTGVRQGAEGREVRALCQGEMSLH